MIKRNSHSKSHLNLFKRHRKTRSMFNPPDQKKFAQTASYFTKTCNYNPIEEKKKKNKVLKAFFINEVKSLEKWKMTMHDRGIIDNLVPSGPVQKRNGKKNANEIGFYDTGTKMIDLMGTVFEESEVEDTVISQTIQPNADGHFTLNNASMVISAQDHNKKIIENVIKKKLRRTRINFNEEDPHELSQQIKIFTQDLTKNFDHLRPYYQSKSNFSQECKSLLRSVLEDKNFKMRQALNDDRNKIDRQNARNAFFEKFERLQSEIHFCDDKKISKQKMKEKEIRKLADTKIKNINFKKIAKIEIAQLKKDLSLLPEMKARYILKGMTKFKEQIDTLSKKIAFKTERLEFLEYELDRKIRYEDIENKIMEKNIKGFDKDIEYIMQVKEGYKYELGVYLKEIMEGNLDADYYTKSIIDYKIMMKKVKFINYDFQNWEGFDPTDLNYIRDISKLKFQLDCIEGPEKKQQRRKSGVLNASQILAVEAHNKKHSHFMIVKKLKIPKLNDVLEKLKKIDYRKRRASFIENSFQSRGKRSGSKSKSRGGGSQVKIARSRSNSKWKYDKRKGGYFIPALELRKMIEVLDKQQSDKLHQEIQNVKRKIPGFFEKKIAMLYGYDKMQEIIGKYKLLNKI